LALREPLTAIEHGITDREQQRRLAAVFDLAASAHLDIAKMIAITIAGPNTGNHHLHSYVGISS